MTTPSTSTRPSAFEGPVDSATYRRVLEAFTGILATEGNRVAVLRNGVEIFPAMLEAVERAERTVDFMTYIYWTGEITGRFAVALADRARAGVRVRVLLDAFGTRQMDDRLVDDLCGAGAVVEKFRPATSFKPWRWNMRTHRRVLVCDDTVAFTGGAGISEEWMGDADRPEHWRDTHYAVEGPAVDAIHAAFTSDWLEVPQPVFDGADRFPEHRAVGSVPLQVVRAASQPGWNDAALTIRALIALARERIRITSAYFRPPRHFLDLLYEAVERGVTVEVLVPGPHAEPVVARWAAEYYYQELLAHGVTIWSYQPTMHHGKIVTVDGTVALVGTSNFDARSLAINEQIGLVIHDADITATLDEHFAQDCAASERIDPESWDRRGWGRRGREAVAHIGTFAPRGGGAARRGGLFG
ncbi:MAG: phospholipase D-like domain-containing protein [Egibacteraceae bacterium]